MQIDTNKAFQISVKGLCRDAEGKVLLMREESGVWELPGGRMERGEDLLETLRRECREETGLTCTVQDERPVLVYSTLDQDGLPRLMVLYAVQFDHLNFTPSTECVEMRFVSVEEMKDLSINPQMRGLVEWITANNISALLCKMKILSSN